MRIDTDAAVIGAGPAGLFAAECLAARGHRVVVFDAMASPARKFLMAGRGGLNLTHSEPLSSFVARYGWRALEMERLLSAFPPEALRGWCEGLGVPSFIGTSGRIFPRAMKASPLLRAWLKRLEGLGVTLMTRHRWTGFDAEGQAQFDTPEGAVTASARATLLALGGASWPRLGSDGRWAPVLKGMGVTLADLKPANCGIEIAWSEYLRQRGAGLPLKRIALSLGQREAKGEAMITAEGLEGGAVYALLDAARELIAREGKAVLHLDLRPDRNLEGLTHDLGRVPSSQSTANWLRKGAKLDAAAALLVNEALRPLPREAAALARLIKSVPLTATGVRPIARAISTAGGVPFEELDAHLMLNARAGVFVAGEMLDWEAPTGGYLMQGCFSSAHVAAQGMDAWLNRPAS